MLRNASVNKVVQSIDTGVIRSRMGRESETQFPQRGESDCERDDEGFHDFPSGMVNQHIGKRYSPRTAVPRSSTRDAHDTITTSKQPTCITGPSLVLTILYTVDAKLLDWQWQGLTFYMGHKLDNGAIVGAHKH